MSKYETLKKTNVSLNKALKTRRLEDEELARDHALRMEKERQASIARKKSRLRASQISKTSERARAGGSRGGSRGSSREGQSSRGESRGVGSLVTAKEGEFTPDSSLFSSMSLSER